jgi:putative ABC transport system permease protein
LLSKDIIKWVIIANLIAWPLVYVVMNLWLSNFAYHVNVNVGILVGSAFLALAIALITVSYQSIKAACANPVDASQHGEILQDYYTIKYGRCPKVG